MSGVLWRPESASPSPCMDPVENISTRRGRPRKFSSPSRAVMLTLPIPVLEALGAIDADLSRAVVRVTQPELARQPHPPAELVVFGRRASSS